MKIGGSNEKKQTEDSVAWLESLKDSNMPQPMTEDKQNETAVKPREEIYNGMTREEVEIALVEIDKEMHDKVSRIAFLYNELIDITQHGKPCPPDTTPERMWDDCKNLFQYVSTNLVSKHTQYAFVLGTDQKEPFRQGGWVYEILKQTPMNISMH